MVDACSERAAAGDRGALERALLASEHASEHQLASEHDTIREQYLLALPAPRPRRQVRR